MLDLSRIAEELQARKGQWRQIAVALDIPYFTLSKIARGTVKNPTLPKVQKLLPLLDGRRFK
jgi:hypothetical protein